MNSEGMFVRDVGQGPPLLLIHGWSCPGVFFNDTVEVLKHQARCIVPDLPGHGATAGQVSLTIEAAADVLTAYLNKEDLNDVTLCGWSMGALVAYAMIERHGAERIKQVVAIDMSPKVVNEVDWPNGTLSGLTLEQNEQVLSGMVSDWERLPGRIAARLFADGNAPPHLLMKFAKREIQNADPTMMAAMWAALTDQDFRGMVKSFPVPLHLAAGLKSQLYGPGVHAWYQENVPEFHLRMFVNSGHAPHLEEPELFQKMLLELL